MKALIISFFGILLGYSLIFNEKEESEQPVLKDSNSVYIDRPENIQYTDSIWIIKDQTAFIM